LYCHVQVIDPEGTATDASNYCLSLAGVQQVDSKRCIVWNKVAELSPMDPRTFNNYEVRLRFDILESSLPDTSLRQTSWMAYRGGECTCLNTGVSGCQCSGGQIFDKGTVGKVNQQAQDGSTYYINQIPMYLEEGGYWMVFSHSSFYPRAVFIQVNGDTEANMSDAVLLLPIIPAGSSKSGRVILNDAAVSSTKVSHTMFLVNTGSPKDKVIWEKQKTITSSTGANSVTHAYASQFAEVITLGENYTPLTWALAIYCHG
jgi:hypothetical protein